MKRLDAKSRKRYIFVHKKLLFELKTARGKQVLSLPLAAEAYSVAVFPVVINILNVVAVLKMLDEKIHILDIILAFKDNIR